MFPCLATKWGLGLCHATSLNSSQVFHLTTKGHFLYYFKECLSPILYSELLSGKHIFANTLRIITWAKVEARKEEAISCWLPLCPRNTQDSFHMASDSVETRVRSIMAHIKYLLVLVKFLLRPRPRGPIRMTTSVIREWINRNAFYKVVFLLADSKLKCCIIHWSSILGHFLQEERGIN